VGSANSDVLGESRDAADVKGKGAPAAAAPTAGAAPCSKADESSDLPAEGDGSAAPRVGAAAQTGAENPTVVCAASDTDGTITVGGREALLRPPAPCCDPLAKLAGPGPRVNDLENEAAAGVALALARRPPVTETGGVDASDMASGERGGRLGKEVFCLFLFPCPPFVLSREEAPSGGRFEGVGGCTEMSVRECVVVVCQRVQKGVAMLSSGLRECALSSWERF